MVKKIQFTRVGYQKMVADLQKQTQKRKETVVRLQIAREMGDLSENGAYKAARWELGGIDRELRRLTFLLKMGIIVEPENTGKVEFGCLVTLDDGKNQSTHTLVGTYESNPVEHKLSVESPLGKAILGKKTGEKVEISTPSGKITYTITKIS